MSIVKKKCKSCGRVLPISNFYRDNSSADGYYYRCKECKKNNIRCKYIYEINEDSRECTICRKVKPLEEFNRASDKKIGRGHICKECMKARNPKRKDYRISEIGRVCTTCGIWKEWSDFAKTSKNSMGHASSCKSCASKRSRVYYQKIDRDEVVKCKAREYERGRKVNNPSYRILCFCRSRIKNALKLTNEKKLHRTHELLGCTPEYFIQYLENNACGYQVKDISRYGLNVDHYIPVNHFDLSNELEQLICFSYLNQQLLPYKENREKWDSLPDDWGVIYIKIKKQVLHNHPELISKGMV